MFFTKTLVIKQLFTIESILTFFICFADKYVSEYDLCLFELISEYFDLYFMYTYYQTRHDPNN
jgi:hypothetical protein